MSASKKIIELKAIGIYFTKEAIVYKVEPVNATVFISGVCFCVPSIKNKELILKPTFIDLENMEVIFSPVNVTVGFYQGLYSKKLRSYSEFSNSLDKIYGVGDVVASVCM